MAKKKKSNFVKKYKDGKEEVNPFELKINKKRHNVLGQRLKNDKGKPGVSRSRAMKRRAEIFQKSVTLTKKSNAFIDKRIGECSDDFSKEDMIVERMTIARKKKYKKDVYNLNDEEALTHYGQPLSEIEKFDFPEEDSDDDIEDAQLGSDYVNKAHFGGFLTKKSDAEDDQKTHKEIIGELILDSKKRKEEKKVEKEMNDDLTEKLDQEWKNFHSLLRAVKDDKDSRSVGQVDPYDMVVKELRFEPRGKPADLVKSEEELKKAELAKLKKLEEERLQRMVGDNNKLNVDYELSPDSIYDGLDLEDEIQIEMTSNKQNDDHSDDDDNEQLKSTNGNKEDSNGLVENDIEIDFSSDIEDFDATNVETSEQVETVDVARIEVPETLDQLARLLSSKSKEEASKLIDSIITSNRRNLDDKTKQKFDLFFCLLLKYVHKISRTKELGFLDVAAPHLYTLTQIAGLKTGLIFKKYLAKKLSDYEKMKVSDVDFPNLDILVALKFSAILYPTSDYRHEIVTPCMLMMSDILTSHYKITLKNVLCRLFVSCLFYEYVSFSKRLAVEPIFFLETILHMASVDSPSNRCPNKKLLKTKRIFSFDSKVETEPSIINLHIFTKESKLKKSADLTVSILYCAVTQLHKFAELYCKLPSFTELFSQTKVLCEHLPLHLYPDKLSTSVKNLKEFLDGREIIKQYLTFPKKKPKMLKMFEPKFEMNESDKKMTLQKQISLEKKLSQKIKREEKSILREVRRDAQFVARKQIQERMEADAERKRKVKQLYQELSIQQGECKKFAKRK